MRDDSFLEALLFVPPGADTYIVSAWISLEKSFEMGVWIRHGSIYLYRG